ncbi:MAG: ABC transporter ATP-binding protein [Kiloniellales bacterium]|nr:ABC transporter ATP-binding protein [Kiloniellales bacterium]
MSTTASDTAPAGTSTGRAAAEGVAVELVGVDKSFGAVHASRDVNMTIEAGSIHGIVGENGAGKSTLMKILYGFYQADAGEIRVKGKPVRIREPRDAIAAGIGMVHQHFMLVDTFTVLENLILGAEDQFWVRRSLEQARDELIAIERDYGLEVPPDALVADLPVGLQQRVEILKILFRGAETIILDEPTAVLTPQETDELFKILRRLKAEGKTVVLITHKLQEIMAVTDAVTVMRDGAVVGRVDTAKTSREQLAEMMVGRKVLLRVDKTAAKPGEAVLTVAGLTVTDEAQQPKVLDLSLEVRAGEILGVAGVSGNGQTELIEALVGLRGFTDGEVKLKGRSILSGYQSTHPRELRHLGLGHVPEDRLRMGVIVGFDASETAILGYHDDPAYNGRLLSERPKIVAHCESLMQAFDVRPASPLLRTGSFSGGNQQKLVLAREIERDPALLLVGQPTRGVDIGAIEFIHRRLIEMRDAGKAILLVSAELEEILALADRIVVMHEGRIVGEMPTAEADRQKIGLLMAGISEDAA